MKKRIFSTAVALAAAMSLSVSAFAAAAIGETDTNPGWSDIVGGSEDRIEVDVNPNGETRIVTDIGLAVIAPKGTFPAGVTKVTLTANIGAVKEERVEEITAKINGVIDDQEKLAFVTYGMSLELNDQNGNSITEFNNLLTVSISKNTTIENNNTVVYLSDDGNTAEAYELKNMENNTFQFSVPHFSKYYLGNLDEGEPPVPPVPPVNTPATTPDPGFVDPGDNDGNTDGDKTTEDTKNPEDGTTAPSNTTDNGSNGGDTNAPADGTNAPVDGEPDDGSNGGNAGDTNGTGNDKNQATGVVLAVVPAAIAAAAVVISKKRK